MLRAGLCDRCTVTQEVAKKQQQDYESSQLQSLQHISVLMSEISALMKENEKLKEEVKGLRRRIEQQNGHPEEARSPEVKRSPEPTASPLTLLTSVLKAERPSAGGATTSTAIVKSENEHCQTTEMLSERTEASSKGSAHKQLQGWSGTYPFELSKLPTPVSPTNPATWRERRAVSVDSLHLDRSSRPSPTSPSLPSNLLLLRKNPLLLEKRCDRVSMPFRPHPIWPLPDHTDWVAMAKAASGSHPNVNRESSPSILRFPSVVTPTAGLEPRSQSQGSSHPQPWSDHLPRRIVSELSESRDRRTTVSVIASPSRKSSAAWPERISGENLKEGVEEIPLDLSSAGGSKVKETETIGTVQGQSQSDMASLSSSSSSSSSSSPPAPLSSPSSAQYASSPQSDPQAGDTKPQREETSERPKGEVKGEKEKKVNVEFTENLKVPTLTISLRPVVVLESLKTTGQKGQDFEQKSSSSQELEQEEENNHSTGRKRAGQDNEVFSRWPLKEKRTRMTVMPQAPNHGDSDQG
ncbi:RBBP8 N-terminal-like protein isoform X2 [Pygocentrus nattereri]|nr:RBBP8 N-terminal-like protein isoform X2 [Pygocentrus nattereri]